MSQEIKVVVSLVLLLALHPAAEARPKTDVITMNNGDRITCEIRSMFAGVLECKTNYMDTVRLKWHHIRSISTDYSFEVRTSEGSRSYGLVSSDAENRQLAIEDIYGESRLDWLDIVELRPLQKTLKDAMNVYLSLGFDYTKATGVGQAQLSTDISYETESSRNSLNARSTLSSTDELDTRSSRVDLSRRSFIGDSARYINYLGTYESNDALELVGRYSLGAGMGRYFLDNDRMQLVGLAGVQVNTEKDAFGESTDSVEGILSMEYSTWRLDTPKLDLRYILNFYPGLTE